MLEMCLPWLAVFGYMWFNVCSERLQVVGGRVYVEDVCDYVGQ